MRVYYQNEHDINTFSELRRFVELMIDEGYSILEYSTLKDFLEDNDFVSSDFESKNYYIHNDDVYRTNDDQYGTLDQLESADYRECEYTGDWFHIDDMEFINDDHQYCSRDYAEMHFYYHEDYGYYTYPPEDDEDDEDQDDLSNYLDRYHSRSSYSHSYSGDFLSVYQFGVEIEKEDREQIYSITKYDFNSQFPEWRRESDGSLNDEGYELISPIFPLNVPYFVDYIKDRPILLDHINANYSHRCGGHISISRIGYNSDELYEQIKFYIPLLYAMYPKRKSGTYCQSKATSLMKIDKSKYSAVYIKSQCVEIRIFPAIRNLSQLEFRLKLIEMMVYNPVSDFAHMRQVVIDHYELFSTVYSKEKFMAMLSRMDTEILADIEASRQWEPAI